MTLNFVAAVVLAALEGYLLGSIVFGILISRFLCRDDVCPGGSVFTVVFNIVCSLCRWRV